MTLWISYVKPLLKDFFKREIRIFTRLLDRRGLESRHVQARRKRITQLLEDLYHHTEEDTTVSTKLLRPGRTKWESISLRGLMSEDIRLLLKKNTKVIRNRFRRDIWDWELQCITICNIPLKFNDPKEFFKDDAYLVVIYFHWGESVWWIARHVGNNTISFRSSEESSLIDFLSEEEFITFLEGKLKRAEQSLACAV